MKRCAVSWCIGVPPTDGQFCVVHHVHPNLHPDKGTCVLCDGTGECVECGGMGDHQCECGDEHDCQFCDGTGQCEQCHGRALVLTEKEQEYLDWATAVIVPPHPVFTCPWEDV